MDQIDRPQTTDQPADGPTDHVPVEAVAATYDDRGLDRLSDDDLVAAVAAVVAEPREGPADSFVLHAPLELTARARLLAETPAADRRLARLRLVSIAARYQRHEAATLTGDDDNGGSDRPEAGLDHLLDAVTGAIDDGDMGRAEAATRALVAAPALEPETAVGRLATAIADRSAAAAHGPILLATLTERPDRARAWLPLARPLMRELARRPDWRLGWLDRAGGTEPADGRSPAPVDPDRLGRMLADPPRLGVPGSSFIHPLLMQVDEPAVADEVLRPVVGADARTTPEAVRAVTRVAALAMVRDDPDHAPYGWTHCLTLPQAVLTLAPALEAEGRSALAIAATHVLAFRAAQGAETLDLDDPLVAPADPATMAERREHLVAQAARRHDAHIAKYVLAVLSEASRDPDASELYLRAGEHLLAVWDGLGPDADDILAAEPGAGGTR